MIPKTAWTVARIRALKGGRPFACLTAGDAFTAHLLDETGLPIILVGDSLGMTLLGFKTTVPVTLDHMLHHTAAVARGVTRALVVADMPFLSYQVTDAEAVTNAGRLIKDGGAAAVKIEGGRLRVPTIRALVKNGIPVMGHIGLLPQSVHAAGYRITGRTAAEARELKADALALQDAGCFSIVLEGMVPATARAITRALKIPTIGIGAGPACDGQILVVNDLLGLGETPPPRFVRRYANLGKTMRKAFTAFQTDVANRNFPGPDECY